MGDRVAVLSPEGQFGTVDAADAEAVTRAGGKVLSKAEVAAHDTQEAYDKQSTATKVATVASMAGPIGYPLHAYLRGQGAVLPPELEAYTQGVSGGFTGGLASVGMKEVVEAVGGQGAAHAYGKTAEQVKEAHSGLYTAGEIAGFAGSVVAGGPKAGLGGVGKVIPGVGISALGGVAEQTAARALAPVAAKGAIGRALAMGGELGARGAVEGALYSGASNVSEAMLGDHEVAADKVYAAIGTGALYGGVGGVLLGGGGSLLASGAKGAASSARSGISKALARGEEAATEAATAIETGATKATEGAASKLGGRADEAGRAAEAVGVKPEKEVSALRKMLSGNGDEAARDVAKAWAFDALGTTRKIADKINTEVSGGTKAVGDYVNRRILKVAADDASLVGSIRTGRADELLPIIQADRAVIGASIGDVVKATPVRVAVDDLLTSAMKTTAEMAADPTRIQGAEAFRKQVGQTFEAFSNGGKLVNGSMDLSEMYYARAKMEAVAHEMKRGNSAAGDAMREWLRDVDRTLVDKIDEAAKAMGDKGAKDKLLGLKREYQLASAAEKAAQDGANRIAGNNTFGIREGIGAAAGLAMGHPLAAIGAAVGGKLLRERGSAAGAYLLTKMADMGTLTRAMRAVDDQVGKASKGLLSAPSKRPLPEAASSESVRTRAGRIMERVAQIQADPERFAEHVARTVEPMSGTAPNIAGALTQRLTSSAAFMASRIPVKADKDPFDPHSAPRLSDAQAAEVVRYHSYIERPMRFFEELEHGKLTYEGVEVIRSQMPGVFAELQQRTIQGLAELMAQGKAPPFAQRERLGMLLKVPATPSQRPEHMKLLQANVLASEANTPTKPNHGAPAHPPKRPLPTKSQPSTLDRLEGR